MMVNATEEESLVGKPTAYLFLAASGLSCSVWDLSLWCTRSLSWCVGSVGWWRVILVLLPGIEPLPLTLAGEFLTIGPPGKSPGPCLPVASACVSGVVWF